MIYKQRWIAEKMRDAVEFSPVIVLSGARQTGKSTLLQNEEPFRDWHYITFDDLDILSIAEKRPNDILNISKNIIIDEAQRSPAFMHAVKSAVDKDKSRRIVLSGSANMLLMKRVSESLAGRAIYFNLLPFSFGEFMERVPNRWIEKLLTKGKASETQDSYTPSDIDLKFTLFRGFLPPVVSLKKEDHIAMWLKAYEKTYLERDLREISEVSYLSDFKKVMELLAIRNASILKQSEVARDAGLSQATLGRYINILETTNLFMKLKPYSKNMSVRLIKSPKIFCIDTGLTVSLAGYLSSSDIPITFMGALLESYVLLTFIVMTSILGGEVFYFRTQGGKEKEVDLVIEKENGVVAVEIKLSETVSAGDIKNLLFFKGVNNKFTAGLLIYTGREVKQLAHNIFAIPWDML
ncbi:MAG: ATP-binding protein [Nitrospirae bacterium]|nr:ATP-binding protein [Nitrospirota bacterium]